MRRGKRPIAAPEFRERLLSLLAQVDGEPSAYPPFTGRTIRLVLNALQIGELEAALFEAVRLGLSLGIAEMEPRQVHAVRRAVAKYKSSPGPAKLPPLVDDVVSEWDASIVTSPGLNQTSRIAFVARKLKTNNSKVRRRLAEGGRI